MNEEHQPKISLPEALIVGPLLFGIPDLIELVLIFFGLDTFWITDALSFPASQIYLRMKGVKSTAVLIGQLLELIPYVGALPLRSIGFIVLVWMDHNPKAARAGMLAAKLTGETAKKKLEAGKVAPPVPTAAEATRRKAGPVPAEELFRGPAGPMEKLQAELAETKPFPEGGTVTLDEEANSVDLRQAA